MEQGPRFSKCNIGLSVGNTNVIDDRAWGVSDGMDGELRGELSHGKGGP